jgi:hypothetical protein
MRKPTNLSLDELLVPRTKTFLGCHRFPPGDKRNGASVSDLVNYLLEVHLDANKKRGVKPDAAHPFGLLPTYE